MGLRPPLAFAVGAGFVRAVLLIAGGWARAQPSLGVLTVLALILYAVLLGLCAVLLGASVSALREALRQRARPRGILLTVALAIASLLGIWALLV